MFVQNQKSPNTGDFCHLLLLENFKAYHAKQGYAGLQIAKKHLPDAIICSRMFSDISCWDVFQALQKEEITKQIPFIFLSSIPSGEYHEKLEKNSSAIILTKPFCINQLMTVIHDCLSKSM